MYFKIYSCYNLEIYFYSLTKYFILLIFIQLEHTNKADLSKLLHARKNKRRNRILHYRQRSLNTSIRNYQQDKIIEDSKESDRMNSEINEPNKVNFSDCKQPKQSNSKVSIDYVSIIYYQ